MPKNIIYLLGAGASANALPVVKDFNPRLQIFYRYLSKKNVPKLNLLSNQVLQILEESKKHSTIDTLAKKYFHSYKNNGHNLLILKRVLIAFFLYEQNTNTLVDELSAVDITSIKKMLVDDYKLSIEDATQLLLRKKNNLDFRYDSFIASLLKSKENVFEFPDHVHIITWNYDSQIELTFRNFCDSSILTIQNDLSIYPIYDLQPIEKYKQAIQKKKFKVLHLNGIADYIDFAPPVHISLLQKDLDEALIQLVTADDFPNMTFAWERNSQLNPQTDQQKEVLIEAKKLLSSPCNLVVIGYSFPYFNREVDAELLVSPQNFSKIYIQDTNANVIKETMLNVFRVNRPSDIIVQDSNQFILPPE